MVIDNRSQLDLFNNRNVFLYPILQDARVHPVVSSILGFVLIDVDTKQTYSVSVAHPESLYHYTDKTLSFLDTCTVYSYDTQILNYCGYTKDGLIDTELQYYLFCNQAYSFENPPIVNHYNRLYPNCNLIGGLIGLQKHEQIALELFEKTFVQQRQAGLEFYQNQLLPAFFNIEKNGLQIDTALFDQRFGQTKAKVGDRCFTHYNFFTTTGRPSNRFGGVNFAALNKEDQTRECFTSRFNQQGCLLEIDFNAYHPRLIASLIGYDFGTDNAYEHLAKQYFAKPTPAASDIRLMKEATFRQIYGGIQQQYLSIPFFFAANELSEELWRVFNAQGFVESPISKRRLHTRNYSDIDRNTLFNYFIQMYETESNVLILNNLHSSMKHLQSVPILYTYDSILFDVCVDEQQQLVEQVLPSCIDYDRFPVKLKSGTVYKDIAVCT
jgi:hypothetical protein